MRIRQFFPLLSVACALPAAHGAGSAIAEGARLAIIGDSITEQKLYSKFIETYLLACAGRSDVECFQFGWSGETAAGFTARMEADLGLFAPTMATLCYGMNDGMYQPYAPETGKNYEAAMRKVLDKLKSMGVQHIVVGSPGAVDTHFFQRFPAAQYNDTLAKLGEIARKLAADKQQMFANLQEPMLSAMAPAKKALGDTFQVAGYDGIHPDPNGHLLMASAFLTAMGMDGHIGTIEVDLQGGTKVTDGHTVLASAGGAVDLESRRWPFCFDADTASPASTRSILPFCTFNASLNRLMLKVSGLATARARVTWGQEVHEYAREQLQQGVNLAADFSESPFQQPFMSFMERIAEKQRYETHAIWNIAYPWRSKHGNSASQEAKDAYLAIKKQIDEQRKVLGHEARRLLVPVKHRVLIEPLP